MSTLVTLSCNYCSTVITEKGDDVNVLAVMKRMDEHQDEAHPFPGSSSDD